MKASIEQYLEELGDAGRPLSAAQLAQLSALSAEEAEIFRRLWPGIDTDRRQQIVGLLVDISEDNLELDFDDVFVICLDDVDAGVRRKAIEGLWGCEERSLIDPLITLLMEDTDSSVRVAAAEALGKFALLAELGKLPQGYDDKIEDALVAVFDKRDEELGVRCRALEAVSSLDTPQVEDLIRQTYRRKSPELRAAAVCAMGRSCNPSWLPVLLKELRSSEPRMRFEAVRACAELEAEEAVPRIMALTRDGDMEVRMSAIEALGMIGGSEARGELERCAESRDEAVREAALNALDEIGFWDDPMDLS